MANVHSNVFVCSLLQLCGGVIMGFGLWLLLDTQSFIVVLSKKVIHYYVNFVCVCLYVLVTPC